MPNETVSNLPDPVTLKRAADLIQAAHDAIEVYGFDIDHYGSRRIDGMTSMCYIGALRYAAGLDPRPDYIAAAGDGPELVEALRWLDKLAQDELTEYDCQEVIENQLMVQEDVRRSYHHFAARTLTPNAEMKERIKEYDELLAYPSDMWTVGRFVEHLGLNITARNEGDENEDEDEIDEQEYALDLLRRALTEIHTHLLVEGVQ